MTAGALMKPADVETTPTSAFALIEILVRNYFATHEPVSVGEMCRVTGFSRRALTYAFQRRYGVPPKRFFRNLALSDVRRELIRSRGLARISDVAPFYGFSNMSRFAAEYRSHFGELPSKTLWRARRAVRPLDIDGDSGPSVSAVPA